MPSFLETIQPRLRLEGEDEPARRDFITQLEAAVPLLAEQRVAEDDVRPRMLIAQPLQFIRDVRDRPRPVACENPVRTVRAELGAATAGEQRIPAADRPREPFGAHPSAVLGDQIPARKRQRVQIVDLLADDDAVRDLSLCQPHHGGFGLAVQDEIAMIGEELGHL